MTRVDPVRDLALKGDAVEEWLDLRFFRPLGIRIAHALRPTRVSADDVTVWSMLIGLVGGHLLMYQRPGVNALGFALFVLSDIFDSADGQLARLRGTSTGFGRVLDGIGDSARFINLYLHLAIRLVLAGSPVWWAVPLTGAALLSHSTQSAGVDFIKNAFLYIAVGGRGELELPEEVSGLKGGNGIERLARRMYLAYLKRQTRLFPRSTELIRRRREAGGFDSLRSRYRAVQQPLLPWCALIGQNIRIFLVGTACMLGQPGLYLWATVTAMNVLFVALVVLHERNVSRIAA